MESFSPGIVLAAYAEPLLEGRRAVVFGDGSSSLPSELLERGARAVLVFDPEPTRAALAAGQNRVKQISIVPLDDADIGVRDGAFDVAIIEDLSAVRDPAALLKRVRRALSARGAAIVASPNPDTRAALVPRTSFGRGPSTLGYYELYDAVSAEFPEVRMLGQTPFVGYAIVDFAPEGEPEVSIDSGLVPGGAEEPEWFVAIAGQSPVATEAISIVQLPSSRMTSGGDGGLSEELRAVRAAEARLVERVAELEAQATALREKASAPRPDPSKERADALEKTVEKLEAARTELEARARAADARADAAIERAESLQKKHDEALQSERAGALRSESAKGEVDRLSAEQTRLKETLTALSTEKSELSGRVASLARERDELAGKLAATERDHARTLSQEKEAAQKKLDTAAAERASEMENLTRSLSAKEAELSRTKREIEERDRKIAKLLEPAEDETSAELAKLEATLKERGERIRTLEGELREAERVGKELVRELSKAHQLSTALSPSAGTGAPPTGYLLKEGTLASENARLVADLEAAGWTIQELEDRLAQTRN